MKEEEYENPWTFNDNIFRSEDINGFEGFVYLITNLETGKKYIGRKYFYQIRKQSGKKRRQRKESDWKNYYGSSKILQSDIQESIKKETFQRKILSLHTTRGDVNRAEVELLWKHNVLYNEEFYNDSIGNHRAAKPHILNSRLTTEENIS